MLNILGRLSEKDASTTYKEPETYSKEKTIVIKKGYEYVIFPSVDKETADSMDAIDAELAMVWNMADYNKDQTDSLDAIREKEKAISQKLSYKLTCKNVNLIKDSEYTMKMPVDRPLTRTIEILDELPADGKYEIIGSVEYTINTTAFILKKIPDSSCLNRMEELAIENNADALVVNFYKTTINPNYRRIGNGVAIKYIK